MYCCLFLCLDENDLDSDNIRAPTIWCIIFKLFYCSVYERRKEMKTIKFIQTTCNVENFENMESIFHVEVKTIKNPGGYHTARKHLVYAGKSCNKLSIKVTKDGIVYSVERDADSLMQRLGFLKVEKSTLTYITDLKAGKIRPRIVPDFTDEFLTLNLQEAPEILANLLEEQKYIVLYREGAKIRTYQLGVSAVNADWVYIPIEGYSDPKEEISIDQMIEWEESGLATRYYTFLASTSQQRRGCLEMIKA